MQRTNIPKNITTLLAKILPKGATAYLFGSQAREDYSEFSDWDLLILLNEERPLGLETRGALSLPLYMLGAEIGVNINPILYTNAEWEKRKFTPFYKNIVRDRLKIWG